MIYILLALPLVLFLVYKIWISIYKTWEYRGVPSLPGRFPYGTDIQLALNQEYFGYIFDRLYKRAAPHPIAGYYDVRICNLIVRDPEIIRDILVKNFSHFRDRQGLELSKKDILSHHLFNVEGEKWRALRVKLSPTFTSGKIKGMFPLFIKCAEAFDSLLMSELDGTIDVKDVFGRFGTDVICSCAFGIDVDSINNSESEFRKIGSNAIKVTKFVILMINFFKLSKRLFKALRIRITPQHVEDFIMKLVRDNVEHREKNNLKRDDFLDLLIQLKNKGVIIDDVTEEGEKEKCQPIEMTIELLAAQCFVFFFAGFETSSSVQTFCTYELALNPDIQERVHKEVVEVLEKHGGITYQAVQEMEYLDMVVSETLRKYPTLAFLTRVCTKDVTFHSGLTIKKNDGIIIPIWSLHHDPEHFPNPDTFDPERFSQENKDSIKPFTFLPFGEGPRNCIGMRFGLLQTKVGLITLLRKYKVEPTEKTTIPLVYREAYQLTMPSKPIYLKISKRI